MKLGPNADLEIGEFDLQEEDVIMDLGPITAVELITAGVAMPASEAVKDRLALLDAVSLGDMTGTLN